MNKCALVVTTVQLYQQLPMHHTNNWAHVPTVSHAYRQQWTCTIYFAPAPWKSLTVNPVPTNSNSALVLSTLQLYRQICTIHYAPLSWNQNLYYHIEEYAAGLCTCTILFAYAWNYIPVDEIANLLHDTVRNFLDFRVTSCTASKCMTLHDTTGYYMTLHDPACNCMTLHATV